MARLKLKIIGPARGIICLILFLIMAFSSPALSNTVNLTEAEAAEDEQNIEKVELKPYTFTSLQTGYRFITPDSHKSAASPFGLLKSGAMLGFSAASIGSDLKLSTDGTFFSEDDYFTELSFDYAGKYRLHVESGALWHNLLSERLPPSSASYTTHQDDSGVVYGTRTSISQVENRINLGNNPLHLNLGYWQLAREGNRQLRFSDHYNGGTSATNNIYAQSIPVNSITREGKIGLDGHFGWLNLSYGFLIRDFLNDAADNRFAFSNSPSNGLITGAPQAHDTIPDSRVTTNTIKLYTDMSGGLVGTAAYALTKRENRGGHGDAVPSSRPADTMHSMAGDISYTPFKELSFALKYRHQEIDREAPASIFYPYSQIPATATIPGFYTAANGTLLVRPATSTVKDVLIFSSIIRPYPKVIYRFDYSAQLEARDNAWKLRLQTDPSAVYSDRRQTHTGKAAFNWKPTKGLRLDAFYSYAVCDNPAYDASFSKRHTGKLLLTYANTGKWGITSSYLNQYESGETGATTYPRESRNMSANASLWFSPIERLTLTTSYSYLQSDTDQTMIISNQSASSLAATNYNSTSHVYGIDANYALNEQLDLSMAFQQVRSNARFYVQDASYTVAPTTFTTSGITDLTRLDTTETSVSARTDWRINSMLGCALDYRFRMYDSGNSLYDGSVHTTILTFKARW